MLVSKKLKTIKRSIAAWRTKNKMEKNDIIRIDESGHILHHDMHPANALVEFHDVRGLQARVNKTELVNLYSRSNAQDVYDWTVATGSEVCSTPTPMNREQVQFTINMLASEIVELAQTVADNPEDAVQMVQCGE